MISETQLKEIIRQAYFIGNKDAKQMPDRMTPWYVESRINQIAFDIQWQMKENKLKPFDYNKLTENL